MFFTTRCETTRPQLHFTASDQIKLCVEFVNIVVVVLEIDNEMEEKNVQIEQLFNRYQINKRRGREKEGKNERQF